MSRLLRNRDGALDHRRYPDGRRIGLWLLTGLALLAPAFAQAQTVVYYSVGTSFPTDLKYGTPSLTIAAGVATFTSPQLGNVGVGDQITYGGATIAYITGRTSATVYSVSTATGGVPAPVGVPTVVNSITRAFGTLTTAEANSTNATHLNTASLTGGNFQLHWAMYNDGPMDDSVIIDGYTTGVNNYIRIFTPVPPSQVGSRQRHTGRAGTGFRLVDINAAPPDPYELIRIMDDHVRIEGIEIDGSRVSGVVDFAGMRTDASVTAAADIRIDKVIIHDIINAVGPGPEDIAAINFGGDGSVRLSNSVLYRMHNRTNDLAGSDTHGIRIGTGSSATLFFHNNTIFDVENVVLDGTSLDGISHGGTGTLTVRNTAVLDITDPAGPGICFTGPFSGSSSNNVSSDATAPGPGSLLNQTANASYFMNVTVGSEDLHLRNDSLAIWGGNGADLSADPNLPIVDDVDGQARAALPDIGADEFGTPPLPRMEVKSGKYVGTGVAGKFVYVGFQPDAVFVKRVGGAPEVNAVLRTSTMIGDNTKSLDNAGIALAPNLVQSLNATGFTVGSATAVNEGPGAPCPTGCDYHWVAFKAAPGYMNVGTYNGDGAALQSIAGIGFEPDYVIVLPPGAGDPAGIPVWTSSTFPMNDSFDFDATFRSPGAITGLESSGFQVGQGNAVVPYRAPDLNVNATTYHYVAWNAVPGSTAVGTYIGNGLDNQYKNQVGFFPEWVLVKKDDIDTLDVPPGERAVTHKPASTGPNTETVGGLRFAEIPPVTNTIQRLLPLGFEVGTDERVNFPSDATCRGGGTCTYHWVAFGPHPPQINYRSIGTAADLTNQGTITVTADSPIVTKSGGTGWAAANRGRGDRLNVGGQNYMILRVVSDDVLLLASPAVASFSGGTYTIARQFTTLQAWENCISFNNDGGVGPGSDACPFFDVASVSLVDDDRSEVGIAYDDSIFTAGVRINGTNVNGNTDAIHTITLTADHGNRHYGIPGAGVQINNAGNPTSAIEVFDDYVTVEWMEIFGGGATPWGIEVNGTGISPGFASTGASRLLFRNNLIHVPGFGIALNDPDVVADVYNNIIYSGTVGLRVAPAALQTWTQIRLVNNTVYNFSGSGFDSSVGAAGRPQQITLINNLMADVVAGGPQAGFIANSFAINGASRNNMATDASATSASPGGSGLTRTLAQIAFVNEATFNLHIQGTSAAVDSGADLDSILTSDIDHGFRQTPWDRGADDTAATTAVTLQSFSAAAGDGAVGLSWETASELNNLGFHVYRAETEGGPYTRITSSLIPGLGSSPTGKSYSHVDSGLVNGQTYYYKLEDVETTGRTELHGPVSATPMATAGGPKDGGDTGGVTPPGTSYGAPQASGLKVLERSSRHVLLELRTGGFFARSEPDGSVRIEVPGYEESLETGLPVKRAMVEAIAGKKVRLASLVASEETSYPGLVPAMPRRAEVVVGAAGEVEISSRRSLVRPAAAPRARLAGTLFQEEVKKAEVLFSPLRVESGVLALSGRILVRLEFTGTETQEVALGGGRGRRGWTRRGHDPGVIAELAVGEAGLYRVTYEDVFGSLPNDGRSPSGRAVRASTLRLSRQGEAVAYHLDPNTAAFGPGSVLYFLSAGSSLNPHGDAVYELEVGVEPLRMAVLSDPVSGGAVPEGMAEARFEENKYYQAGLLEAEDLWQWDLVIAQGSPASHAYPFTLSQVSPSSTPGGLVVDLQAASDFEGVADHHLRAFLNGTLAGEVSWDSMTPRRLAVPIEAGVLHDGPNELRIENVGDAGAAYSMVFLNRFTVRYPRRLVAEGGQFEGLISSGGRAEVEGLSAPAYVLDTTEAAPRWMQGIAPTATGIAFRAEAGRSYLATATALSPRVIPLLPSALKSVDNQADYLVIGPQAFLDVAEPLLEHRRSQGLVSRAVSTEEIFQQFGHGENTPVAIREFLEHAWHQWQRPSPRYVLLLGDASYDPKDFLKTGVKDQIPAVIMKTSYLWTASDPAYAAVNGSDLVPDLAIGRLSASSVEEARLMVEKVLAFENTGQTLSGAAALVADNPDAAGDFEGNANEIASTVLASRNPERIFLREQGTLTRPAIHAALDRGLSLLSYVGHGGTVVWASENVFNYQDVSTLALQPQQPLLMTMNCLNGFFHFPPMNSLSEALVKAEGKGAIAAFSPSGLSVNDPAHLYHKALLAEILSGRHLRLGDAVLAAQQAYADSGAFPELLSIYHLFGDPALKIQ